VKLFIYIVQTSRIKQQSKNLLILVPIFLSANYWWPEQNDVKIELAYYSIIGIISFVFSSWLIYIINDFVDKEKDITHPEKSKRPIVSGKISTKIIIILSVILLFLSLALGIQVNSRFFMCVVGYIILMILYCVILKKIFLIDVLTVSIGYMLRALAGVAIITGSIFFTTTLTFPVWIILCTGFGALFILFIKRLAELNSSRKQLKREVIYKYNLPILNILINSVEILTYVSYIGYCFSYNLFPSVKGNIPSDYSLIFTLPFVIFGMRYYKKLCSQNKFGDQPEEVIFNNKLLSFNFIVWVIMSSLIILFRN